MVNDPYKQLVEMIETLIKKHTARLAAGVTCELGTITSTGLKLDGFKHEIKNYLVSEHLTLDKTDFTETETDCNDPTPTQCICTNGSGTMSAHNHQVKTPSQLGPLKNGDRVLVAPVNHGQDFVVIGRVAPNA
jgi:hypothetical protein